MTTKRKEINPLDISFKEFMPGQIIQSGQFNDDMNDIEEKVNELIDDHNVVSKDLYTHIEDKNNPHNVDAHQTGTYYAEEIDEFIQDVKSGNLYDNAITNRVLDDDCVDNRNIIDGSITNSKLDSSIGSQIDISQNISITDRYTKEETDLLIQEKVGDGTYDKETIDEKLEQIQAGQILDKSISIHQLKDDVGRRLDISNNPDIINKYTREEVDLLIRNNALPRDWGSILEEDVDIPVEIPTREITLPVANHMKAGTFTVSKSSILDVDIQENVDARGEYNTVGERLDNFDSQIKDITNYNIKNEIDFNSNDISITINRLIPLLNSGDKLFIPRGKYYFNNTLDFENLKEGVQIIIDGELIRNGSFSPAIKINGNGFDFSLYKLLNNSSQSGIGVLIGGGNLCFEGNINIKRIENFDVGIELNPKSNQSRKGIQYNTLKGKLIVNCNKCIFLNLEDPKDGWINENTFYDFRLIGHDGLITNNVSCEDNMGYNNNKFYNIGFEQLTGNGINLKYCNGTSFVNCRMLEDIGGTYIKTDNTCFSNLFLFSHIIYENKLDLQGDGDRIIAGILDDNGTIISNGFIVSASKNKIHEISNETCQLITNDCTIRRHDKSLVINSATNPITITLPKEYNREGFRMAINVADYQNNIVFKDYNNNVVINNKINCAGIWEISYIFGAWECYRINYNIKQLPAQYTDANTLEEISTQFRLLLENMRTIGLMKY